MRLKRGMTVVSEILSLEDAGENAYSVTRQAANR
jgi:hypothetical protein